MKLTSSQFTISLVCLFPFLSNVAGVPASNEDVELSESHTKSFYSSPEEQTDITTALFKIAKVLETNHEQTNLNARVSDLEARLSICLEQNESLEKRIQFLENEVPVLKSKFESSSEFLDQNKALENTTKEMLLEFEEKLSTLAGEIVRLKRVAMSGKAPSRTKVMEVRNMLEEVPREVALGKRHGQQEKGLQQQEEEEIVPVKDSGFRNPFTQPEIQFKEMRQLCSSFPVSSWSLAPNGSLCLFTSEGKRVQWRTAEHLCRLQNGTLATLGDVESLGLVTETNLIFWISGAQTEDGGMPKEPELQGPQRSKDDHISSVPSFLLQHSEDAGGSPAFRGKKSSSNEVIAKDSEARSSGVVKIRHLPHSNEESDNIEKNAYISNLVEDDVHPDDAEDDLNVLEMDKIVSGEANPLSAPKDAVNIKDFLLLQETEEDDKREGFKPSKDRKPMFNWDLKASDLFSTLRGNLISSSSNRKDNECPLLVCPKESSKCKVIMWTCSELNSFWCKRKV